MCFLTVTAQSTDTLQKIVVAPKSCCAPADKDKWSGARPDGHAPIGVMCDHYHRKNEVMFSYRYMPMWMNGNLSGSNKISDGTIAQNYMMVPQSMQMDMHMLCVMYAPADFVTLMAMASYNVITMHDKMIMGEESIRETMRTSGFGDVSLYGFFKILNKKRQSFQANVGLSMPAGSVKKKGDMTAMGFRNVPMDYTMQMGSGTFDPIIGCTYLGQTDKFSWGILPAYTIRAYRNTQNYSLGNRFDVTAWGGYKINKWVSVATSLTFFNTSKIKGADKNFTPSLMPQFNAANTGRSQIDIGIGSNFLVPSGKLRNIRLAVEARLPVYQYVNGIQMHNTASLTVGIQYGIGCCE